MKGRDLRRSNPTSRSIVGYSPELRWSSETLLDMSLAVHRNHQTLRICHRSKPNLFKPSSEFAGTAEVRRMVLREYAEGAPKDSDMEVITNKSIGVNVPQGSNAVLVKNLYLSCDLYMGHLMHKTQGGLGIFTPYTPGSVIMGYGVAKVMDSGHPNFKKGDLVWGITGWEEYSLITKPEGLFKIDHTDVPLSYYTGILGN
ncbi:hypothetical protein RHSIM_Rhsim05G0187900 [Rhododendron simsii]|uniref:Oxidoreductase N-terminal domain-containing protein n=1 Tax=Rhododendron simsii TaxID=118357 RepID=A0A834LN59_RHOSS|nr:hypothetical protein RHSIM_Rhsim05G0187900 [Rhododendron simsii]